MNRRGFFVGVLAGEFDVTEVERRREEAELRG